MPMFSRRHYHVIASVLQAAKQDEDNGWNNASGIGRLLADRFEHDNPRFDREHFLAVVRGERPINSRPRRG